MRLSNIAVGCGSCTTTRHSIWVVAWVVASICSSTWIAWSSAFTWRVCGIGMATLVLPTQRFSKLLWYLASIASLSQRGMLAMGLILRVWLLWYILLLPRLCMRPCLRVLLPGVTVLA